MFEPAGVDINRRLRVAPGRLMTRMLASKSSGEPTQLFAHKKPRRDAAGQDREATLRGRVQKWPNGASHRSDR
jgi:hypothetical protein